MKKFRIFSLAAILLAGCLLFSSCYGPFRLTTKLHAWNGTVGGKWANEAVFLAFYILPVYSVAVFLDAVIFNSIEFWGGTNPISMEEGDSEIQMVTSGDEVYLITATKNKFRIEQVKGPQAGETMELLFVPQEHSCYLNYKGEVNKLVEYLPSPDGRDQANLFLPDGSVVSLDAAERDLDEIRQILQSGSNYLTSRD